MTERAPDGASTGSPADVALSYGDEADEGVASGLAAERTEMAWSRTGLAMIGCGVVIAKGLPALSWSSTEQTRLFPETASHPILGGSVLGRHVATWSDLAPTAYGTAAVGVAALMLSMFLTS
jgi:hypothetical protein